MQSFPVALVTASLGQPPPFVLTLKTEEKDVLTATVHTTVPV